MKGAFLYCMHGVRPIGRPATSGTLCQLRMMTEHGAIVGMIIGRRNGSTWRKPVPMLLRQPQTSLHSNCGRLSGKPAAMARSKGALTYVLTFQGVDCSDYGLLYCEIVWSWHLGPHGAGNMPSQNISTYTVHSPWDQNLISLWFVCRCC
jgi:hypothetical protein